jgi:hypothetical protein
MANAAGISVSSGTTIQIETLAKQDENYKRLMGTPGSDR